MSGTGVGLAPWNVTNHSIKIARDGKITSNGHPLIFYHFHGLKVTKLCSWLVIFQPALNYRIPRIAIKKIYVPYLKQIARGVHSTEYSFRIRPLSKFVSNIGRFSKISPFRVKNLTTFEGR
jgi:hypothetical protein